MPSHFDAIMRALERERESLLARTHAAFSYYTRPSFAGDSDSDEVESEDDEGLTQKYDVYGRQARFRGTVRQRQARLEFLRRQDMARRRLIKNREIEETTTVRVFISNFRGNDN